MQFTNKRIDFSIPILSSEIAGTDYLYIYDTANLLAPASPKLRGVVDGDNTVFAWFKSVLEPGVNAYKWIAYDAIGNEGTASGSFEADTTDMIPAKPGLPQFKSYSDGTLVLAAT
jgi:hypothetical protein